MDSGRSVQIPICSRSFLKICILSPTHVIDQVNIFLHCPDRNEAESSAVEYTPSYHRRRLKGSSKCSKKKLTRDDSERPDDSLEAFLAI